jgi:hypothetical protein
MKVLVIVLALAGAPASDFTIIPGTKFGPIRETTTRAELATLFPPPVVEDADVYIGEGFCAPGARMYAGTPDEIEMTWQDAARSHVAFVRAQKPGARWSTARGVRIGTRLTELERLAGHALTFSGFGWDYGGGLEWPEAGGSIRLRLTMGDVEKAALTEQELDSIEGDKPVWSDLPAARRLKSAWRRSSCRGEITPASTTAGNAPIGAEATMARLIFVGAAALALLLSVGVHGQVQRYALDSADGLTLHNVTATMVMLQGKKGLRVAQDEKTRGAQPQDQLAILSDVDFSNGVIEVELAGAPERGASEGARGFVGVAFRVRDAHTYDAFYLRPTNGRAADQERRNHAVQYISHPDWPWQRLRSETPGRYESYVDLLPDEWTNVKIDVRGEKAFLYVHGAQQPTLVVNDVKSGADATGKVALWIGPETIGHFRNLTVTHHF